MKRIIIVFVGSTVVILSACNGGNQVAEKKDAMNSGKMAKMGADTSKAGDSLKKVDAPVIKASFTGDVSAHMNEVVSHYFHIKHALTKDDAAEAKNGATMLLQVISQFDNSLLTAEQKPEYAKHISGVKEHADAIVQSADVNTQRMRFSELSTHMYELVKAFGAGKKIYYDHCPMALNNKGANWLNDVTVIQNPYLGTKMPDCGSVEQVIE